MIFVENIKNWVGNGEPAFYIGRKCGQKWPESPLGNPFRMHSEDERGLVIAKYRTWLWQRLQYPGSEQYKMVHKIAHMASAGIDVHLLCWCKPLACHGDVVKAAIEWMLNTVDFGK